MVPVSRARPQFVLGAMSAEHDGEAAAARSRAAGLFRLGIWRWTSTQCHALLDLVGYGVGAHLWPGGKGAAGGGGAGGGMQQQQGNKGGEGGSAAARVQAAVGDAVVGGGEQRQRR